MNTNENSHLDTLLSRWERLRLQGTDVAPDELCADCPELASEMHRRIQALIRVEALIPTPPESINATCSDPREVPSDEALTVTRPESHFPPLPVVIDGYELVAQIGVGGMGVVYRARQIGLERDVAIKMILAGHFASDEHRERFRCEAKAVARLEHPNIVAIHATGEQDGLPYFVMQLLEGGSLSLRLKQGAMPVREAALLIRDLARALQAVHAQDIVHRDLKPANVLFTAEGVAKITDFGLAKLLDVPEGLTNSDAIMGTPGYLAPEQARGKSGEAGPPADLYALGAILYQCLAGVAPFHGLGKLRILEATQKTEPVPPSSHRRGLPADLDAVCLKCLAKLPQRRYASAQALADDLDRFLADTPTLARPPGLLARLTRPVRKRPLLAAGVCLAALLILAAPFALSHFDPQRPARDMQRQLAAGRSVPLLGEDGQPRSQRWGVSAGSATANKQRKELAFQSFHTSLLEVLPTTGRDTYRFSVRIRHDEGDVGDVGVFFALQRIATDQGEVCFFVPLTFNDLAGKGDGWQKGLSLNLQARSEADATGKSHISTRRKADKPFWFTPSEIEGGKGPWRRLEVRVTKERIRTYWDGQLAHDQTFEQLNAQMKTWLAREPQLAGLGIRFDVRGGLGLVVSEASAVFSEAVVEPLTTDE